MAEAMFHVKHEGALPSLDGPQDRRLERYEHLLTSRAVPAGMISPEDLARLHERHILDSLRAAVAVEPDDRSAYDIGSGAGLPGIVIAIARPDLRITLIERRRRRAAFLELVVDELRLTNAAVIAGGSETLVDRVDLVFARALAPAGPSWDIAEPLLRPDGRLVYFAGEGFRPEDDLPKNVQATLLVPRLAASGSLVIMARQ